MYSIYIAVHSIPVTCKIPCKICFANRFLSIKDTFFVTSDMTKERGVVFILNNSLLIKSIISIHSPYNRAIYYSVIGADILFYCKYKMSIRQDGIKFL